MHTVKNLNTIPEVMRSRKQWVKWSYEGRKGKETKPPRQLNNEFAKTNDPLTWAEFNDIAQSNSCDGIGYVFAEGDGLVGIDLDHCFLDGQLADWAIKIVELFYGTYIEHSPSGDGLHIICEGKALKTGAKKWKDDKGIKVGIEVYDFTSPRYLTVTGDSIQGSEIKNCQNQLEHIYQQFFCDEDNQLVKADGISSKNLPMGVFQVQDALNFVPADDYEIWLKVGMALKTGGYPINLWDDWSKKSEKYESGICIKKWETFRRDGLGIGSVFHIAKQYGWTITQYAPPSVPITKLQHENNGKTTFDEPKSMSVLAANQVQGNPVEHDHWQGQFIPFSYRLTNMGLLKTSEEKPLGEIIAGPIFVAAQTASPEEKDGGLILEVENLNGKHLTVPIPRTRIHEDAGILARDLASLNYFILPGREKELLRYIGLCRPTEQRIAVTQTGWALSNDPDHLVFVLPNSATEPGYHFQPERFSRSTNSVVSRGTLQDWIDNVFDTSPYPLFAVLVALSSSILKFASMDSGGVNFYGGSSSGKTTLAQIAASVFGNGADPANAASKSYINRWNTTLNALEGLASAFNDLPLILDELGSCNARDFGRAIYDLSGGQGKSAMDSSRNMRDPRSWCVGIISTGEVSSQTKIEEALIGKRSHAKAGQLIRLIDIEIKSNIFSGRQQVDKVKRACALYYGTLGQAYIQAIVEQFTTTDLRNVILDNLDRTLNRLINSHGKMNAVQERAMRRFAIAETSGHLLVHLKLIPALTNDLIRQCIETIVDDWMPSSMELSDSARAITALREFILKNRDTRFKNLKEYTSDDKLHREIAGYYDSTRGAFFLLPGTFQEASGSEPQVIATVLKEQGYLLVDRKDRLVNRVMVDGNSIKAYCIRESFLEGDAE